MSDLNPDEFSNQPPRFTKKARLFTVILADVLAGLAIIAFFYYLLTANR